MSLLLCSLETMVGTAVQKHTSPVSTGAGGNGSRRRKMASPMSIVHVRLIHELKHMTRHQQLSVAQGTLPSQDSAVLNSKQKAA